MNRNHADQIARLLNQRNQLVRQYNTETIIEQAEQFLYEIADDQVVACIEVKKVQWYQWEILHLSVDAAFEGRGFGRKMITKAEEKAVEDGARILQCTIRVGNKGSEHIFRDRGFQEVGRFYYPNTGNDVAIWQKVVSLRNDAIRA